MKPIFNHMDKKVIFFDLYDTLIDRDKSYTQALKESLVEFTARWDDQHWNPASAVEAYQKEWSKQAIYPKKVRAHTKKQRLVKSKRQRQLSCLSSVLQDAPFEVTSSFLQTLLRRTKSLYVQQTSLYPDVQHTLEQLITHYKLAVISNGKHERIIQAIRHAGLSSIFPDQTIFVPSNPRTNKPHPDIFHKALRVMGVEPSEAIMVGNSWTNDIFGSNRCGMDAIWIQAKNQRTHIKRIGRNKVITISKFKQLLSLFG